MAGAVKGRYIFAGLVGAAAAMAVAQDAHIVVRAVDGRNGKPFASQRLLVFAAESPQSVRKQEKRFEVFTDEEGLAALTISLRDLKWIQVWVDSHVLCQNDPNSKSFGVAEILSTGLITPNTQRRKPVI
jgi:hypothetical protein